MCFFHLVLKQVNVVIIEKNIKYPHAKICVPDVVENLNVKVFHLMSTTNEIRFIEWHKTCKCSFGANVCNNKQRWNKNKCKCGSKELINKGKCDKSLI